jgi:hypothetical protein
LKFLLKLYVKNKLAEGDKKIKDLENLWTLKIINGKWKLTIIEKSDLNLTYVKMENNLSLAEEYI